MMKFLAIVLLLVAAALGELRAEPVKSREALGATGRYSLASLDPAVIRAAFSVYPNRLARMRPAAPAPEPGLASRPAGRR